MLSIIIPIYNEGLYIRKFILKLIVDLKTTKFSPCEILFIDDGSQDNTSSEIEDAINSLNLPKGLTLKIMSHPVNCGYGSAIKSGLKNCKFDTCAIIDADSTYKIEDLLTLYKLLKQENFDMVVGSREGHFKNEKFIKKFLRKLLKFLVEYMASSKVPDINSGLRIFHRNDIINKEFLLSNRFSFTSTITLLFLLQQKTIKYVPIDYQKRRGESKVKLFRDGITTVGQMLTLAAYLNPIKLLFPILITLFSFIPVMFILTFLYEETIKLLVFVLIIYIFNIIFFLSVGLHVIGLLVKTLSTTYIKSK